MLDSALELRPPRRPPPALRHPDRPGVACSTASATARSSSSDSTRCSRSTTTSTRRARCSCSWSQAQLRVHAQRLRRGPAARRPGGRARHRDPPRRPAAPRRRCGRARRSPGRRTRTPPGHASPRPSSSAREAGRPALVGEGLRYLSMLASNVGDFPTSLDFAARPARSSRGPGTPSWRAPPWPSSRPRSSTWGATPRPRPRSRRRCRSSGARATATARPSTWATSPSVAMMRGRLA